MTNNPLPKVSIIVPAYNNGEYIGEALDSVIAQTYPYWECIVVDDGSTDNTREIVAEYCQKESRITYLYQENSGPSVARNNGIEHTSGEFILPLDADDKIADTYLEKAVNHFIQHPETTLVYCRVELFGKFNEEYYIGSYEYNDLIYDNCIICCTAMYKRVDYYNTKGYNPNMIHGLEDLDFWLTLLSPNSIVFKINEILFYYRTKQHSRSSTLDKQYRSKTLLQLINNHTELFDLGLLFDCFHKTKELEKIISSREYRLSKIIICPFAWIKNKLSKHYFFHFLRKPQ